MKMIKKFEEFIIEGKLSKNKPPKIFNIDGIHYEQVDNIIGGGDVHPGYRFKDSPKHNVKKLKHYKKHKDGYRYAQDYNSNPDKLHIFLTT